MASKNLIIGAIVVVAIVVVLGIVSFSGPSSDSQTNNEGSSNVPGSNENSQPTTNWKDVELTNINTGETFTISQFDKPVLLESFAVWCPYCKAQQEELIDFHKELGYSESDVISIGLDTDANEDEAKVKAYIGENGFTWYYAVAPSEMTQSLIDEFGPTIVNAPSVPMVLICPDGTTTKLDNGHKDTEELKAAVDSCAA